MTTNELIKKASAVNRIALAKKVNKFNKSVKPNKRVNMISAYDVILNEEAEEGENVKPDWNAAEGTAAEILNKPVNATTTVAGFMSAEDKTKLEGIAAGAEVNVQSDWNATEGDAVILNKPATIPNIATTYENKSTDTANLVTNTFTRCTGNPLTIHLAGFSSDVVSEVSGTFVTGASQNSINFTIGDGSTTITWKDGSDPSNLTSGTKYMFSIIGSPIVTEGETTKGAGFYGVLGKLS